MLSKDGVVKIADFGLAAFSRKKDKDPWNLEKDLGGNGQLCAKMMGGTPQYFCPEQIDIFNQLPKVGGEDAQRKFDEEWMLTPASSDLYQATMTMLEAHARFLPNVRELRNAKSSPQEPAAVVAARTPESELAKLSPEETEGWLFEKIEPQLESGVLIANGIGGTQLIELARASSPNDLMKSLALKNIARSKKLQIAIRRHMSTRADVIVHEKVGAVLIKCLDPAVGERYSTASEVLKHGLGTVDNFDYGKAVGGDYQQDITKAVGGDSLPRAAHEEKSSNHSDAIVDATLGGLTRRLVEYKNVQGAHDSSAEWMGVTAPDARPSDAVSVYCKLWKDFGGAWRTCDLSRKARGHWREDMLSGAGVILSLATSLGSSAALRLEQIDLSEQKELEGGVLEILFGACVLPALRKLTLVNCSSTGGTCGTVPAAIGGCKSLVTLDLSNSGFEGAIPVELGQLVNLTRIWLRGNRLKGAWCAKLRCCDDPLRALTKRENCTCACADAQGSCRFRSAV